jgi:hypothetical protein
MYRNVRSGVGKFCARDASLGKSSDGRRYIPPERTPAKAVQAAPAMYRAKRPQLVQRSVTCERGGGGISPGSRSMGPEQDGQLNGEPVRSLEMRLSA